MEAPVSPSQQASPPPLRVLIIGVRDYTLPWAPVAQGALHDAIGWWRYAVLHLGADPANVRVLTSPVLTATELATIGVRPDSTEAAAILALAEATPRALANGENAEQGIEWLLEHPEQKLLTFSGHGIANPMLLGALGRRPVPADFWLGFSDHELLAPEAYQPELIGAYPSLGRVSLARVRSTVDRRMLQDDPRAAALRTDIKGLGDAVLDDSAGSSTSITSTLDELTVVIDACFSTPVLSDTPAATVGHGPLHAACSPATSTRAASPSSPTTSTAARGLGRCRRCSPAGRSGCTPTPATSTPASATTSSSTAPAACSTSWGPPSDRC